MPIEDWIQHSKAAQFLYDWQTVIAGVLALAAAFGTVAATIIIASRQIAASREEANRVVAATREQTSVTAEQTETTVRLERMRDASEASAFHAMFEAAMARILDEASWAKRTYPNLMTPQEAGASPEALVVRNCITKGKARSRNCAPLAFGGVAL